MLHQIGEEELTLEVSPRYLGRLLLLVNEDLSNSINNIQQMCKLGFVIEPEPEVEDHKPRGERAAA